MKNIKVLMIKLFTGVTRMALFMVAIPGLAHANGISNGIENGLDQVKAIPQLLNPPNHPCNPIAQVGNRGNFGPLGTNAAPIVPTAVQKSIRSTLEYSFTDGGPIRCSGSLIRFQNRLFLLTALHCFIANTESRLPYNLTDPSSAQYQQALLTAFQKMQTSPFKIRLQQFNTGDAMNSSGTVPCGKTPYATVIIRNKVPDIAVKVILEKYGNFPLTLSGVDYVLAEVKNADEMASCPTVKLASQMPGYGENIYPAGITTYQSYLRTQKTLSEHVDVPDRIRANPIAAYETTLFFGKCTRKHIRADDWIAKLELSATNDPKLQNGILQGYGENLVAAGCPVSQGMSGGPVFNNAGELVGINSFFYPHKSSSYPDPMYGATGIDKIKSTLMSIGSQP